MVKEIAVKGNKVFSTAEVVSLSGLSSGLNIFKVNLKQAESKVGMHPMIKAVQIIRDFPATIIIDITEREQAALVYCTDSFAVISSDGYCLIKESSPGQTNLPIITGEELKSLAPGQKIPGEKLAVALDYLKAMPVNLRAAVSELNVSDLNNIRMYTMDKAEVRFGDKNRIMEKINLYQEVIRQKYDNKIQYIDISYKGSPVIKFVSDS
ncbi:cell division protein FtsQ/DivIB [Phosphitispora sp. TUW77]|uniref:cell division protein FtsQ/DivIB n=1 Tax=Phosphitispora sp. TUW77 TaxID=3152361 RepID=UPI003AB69C78